MRIVVVQPWLPHRERRGPRLVDTLLLHATAGSSAETAIETLRERGLSYHYIIEKDGAVYKCAPMRSVAFHAGESQGPQGAGVNEYSVGVSLVNLNDGKDPYTAEQQASARVLARTLMDSIPGLRWLATHASVSPGRKSDPLDFDAAALAADVGLSLWTSPKKRLRAPKRA